MRTDYLIVFLGGGIGSACRHGVNLLSARWFGGEWPAGTLTINVLGSLLMGMIAAYAMSRGSLSPHLKLLLMTGLLGGFTTFSAFSLEIVQLFQRGQTASAVAYATLSVLAGVAAILLGMWLTQQVISRH